MRRMPRLRRSSRLFIHQTIFFLVDAVHSGGAKAPHPRRDMPLRRGKTSRVDRLHPQYRDIRHTSIQISPLTVGRRGSYKPPVEGFDTGPS